MPELSEEEEDWSLWGCLKVLGPFLGYRGHINIYIYIQFVHRVQGLGFKV